MVEQTKTGSASDQERLEPGGYGSPSYVAGLSEFGTPLHLPQCNGWLLERSIPDTKWKDAMGAYPFFCCDDWRRLGDDLDKLRSRLISVVLVPEPFGHFELDLLKSSFDRVAGYKEHYVADLDNPIEQIVKRSHKATVRRARNKVDVNICPHPWEYLDQWSELFANLARRHNIEGIRAFSKEAFAQHLRIPDLVMFEARAGNTTVGLDLWYVQGDVAYGHLVGFSDRGYQLRASYATKWEVLNYFRGKVRWLDLGGVPDSHKGANQGLAHFKEGWATGRKTVYLCTRIFQHQKYEELCTATRTHNSDYFPAYRDGELM